MDNSDIDFSEQERESFYKAIYSRRDVRSNFTSEQIDDQVLMRILKAGITPRQLAFLSRGILSWSKTLRQGKKSRNRSKMKKPEAQS